MCKCLSFIKKKTNGLIIYTQTKMKPLHFFSSKASSSVTTYRWYQFSLMDYCLFFNIQEFSTMRNFYLLSQRVKPVCPCTCVQFKKSWKIMLTWVFVPRPPSRKKLIKLASKLCCSWHTSAVWSLLCSPNKWTCYQLVTRPSNTDPLLWSGQIL